MSEAKIIIESWRLHHDAIRPHASLRYHAPAPEVFVPALAAWPAAAVARDPELEITSNPDHSVGADHDHLESSSASVLNPPADCPAKWVHTDMPVILAHPNPIERRNIALLERMDHLATMIQVLSNESQTIYLIQHSSLEATPI